jgi:hypothetical protein
VIDYINVSRPLFQRFVVFLPVLSECEETRAKNPNGDRHPVRWFADKGFGLGIPGIITIPSDVGITISPLCCVFSVI